ncbi:hypothetical protein BKA82DRAFT_121524, partial [Pisolithus tinctorius]
LKAKVKELQSILFASRTGTPHDDTQRSNEERADLLKELQEVRTELNLYRRRTAIFGAEDEELTDVEDHILPPSVAGLLSSIRDARTTPPTPSPPRRESQMLLRTDSGSVIHGVSKQPTPAPSDEEHLDIGADQGMEYATNEGDMAYAEDVFANGRQEWQVVTEGGQVITPDMTPSVHEEQDIGGTSVFREKLASLERVLAEKDEKLADLRSHLARKDEALEEKDKEMDHLQQTLTSKDNRITQLRDAVANQDIAIAEKDGVLSQKDAELSKTRATLVDLEDKLRDQAVLLKDKDGIITTLRSEIDNLRCAKEVAESQVTTQKERLEGLHRGVLQKLSEMEQTIQQREDDLDEKNRQIADKDAAIAELEGNVQSIGEELEEAQTSMDDLIERLRSSETQKTEMETDLRATIDAVRKEKDGFAAAMLVLRAEKASTDTQNEELCGQVTSLTRDLRGARAEHTAAKEAILGLLGTVDAVQSARDDEAGKSAATRQALGLAQTEAAKLREQVHEAEMEIQEVRGELAVKHVALVSEQTTVSMLRSDLNTARGELATVRKKLETTDKELSDTRTNIKRVEDEAEELKAAKMADENTIADLKTLYEKLKRVQAEWVNEVDQKVCPNAIVPCSFR